MLYLDHCIKKQTTNLVSGLAEIERGTLPMLAKKEEEGSTSPFNGEGKAGLTIILTLELVTPSTSANREH